MTKTYVGINGLGRIGKCIFLQLLNDPKIVISGINILNYDINQLEKYLKYDSVHKYNNNFTYNIIDNSHISINNNIIKLFNEKDASNINWNEYNINYVIDATGFYLTEEKAKKHNVDYVIISAPPKDDTPMYVVGVNDSKYNGENIISNASCTTNCITPLLKILNDEFEILKGNFTTIHATTSSQSIADGQPNKNRTYRSIFNNIIPHSTGASKAIDVVLPEINGKIKGTSLRIPTSDVSIVDCNLLLNKITSVDEILQKLRSYNNIEVNNLKLVSSDFLTTECPTIVDSDCLMDLGNNEYKFMIWYDNEWSYSAQLVKMLNKMILFNNLETQKNKLKNKYFIENGKFENKKVLIRVDYNVPVDTENNIKDTFRIDCTLKTIKKILNDNPKYIILTTHFGRPKDYNIKFTTKFLLNYIEKVLNQNITFLEKGFHLNSLEKINNKNNKIYLMENVRFHNEEQNYNQNFIDLINSFCDIYVNDAFGCCHRDHASITGFHQKESYFGYNILKETKLLDTILYDNNKKMAIIGGGKMDSKLKLLKNLCKTMDTIYICGGNINSILKGNFDEYLEEISSYKAEIVLMEDGYKAKSINDNNSYYNDKNQLNNDEYFFDCGQKSLKTLERLINNHNLIFWNGVCGVIEKSKYILGSQKLLELLNKYNKKTVVAGGDTVGFVNWNSYLLTNKNIELCSGGGSSIDYLTSGTLVGLKQFL